MNDEEVIFSLIKKDCEKRGHVEVSQLEKMASILNIHPTKYQKILQSMIEDRKIQRKGEAVLLV